MRKLALLLVAALFAVACVSKDSEKLGVRPSGPGQTDMAHSQSVAIASNQNATQGPSKTTAVTESDETDTSSYCQSGIWVGTQDGGVAVNVAVSGTGDTAPALTDAGGSLIDANMLRVLTSIPQGTFVPGSFQRIMSTSTTAINIVCLGH